jgi:hypothetical protein
MSDFDNDGFDDLAVGVHGDAVGTAARAGAVNLLYGSLFGLAATGNQLWHQDSAGVAGGAEPEDSFGSALAAGDFDGDGFDDLAVGALGEDLGTLTNAGTVNVLQGSAAGLAAAGGQLWHQNGAGVAGGAESDDAFGSALAAGDFDGDGFDDLAVGVLGEDLGTAASAGAVNLLQGSAAGLAAAGRLWSQNSAGVDGVAESGDVFGDALAAGDFDGDGFDDLAVGARGEDLGAVENAGAVSLLRGSAAGLATAGGQLWHQNSAGVAGVAESDDVFGDALAVGDFDNDGFDDLAVGARGEDLGAADNAGAVSLLRGSAGGLTAADGQLWHQNSAGIAGVAETGDLFGSALAVGDFDNDGFDDLAIGARGEDLGAVGSAGAVSVLYGSGAGLTATGSQLWHQDVPDVEDGAESSDVFGDFLTVGDFNDDGFDDLAVGASGEDANAGAVNLLLGSAAGLTAAGDQIWDQDSSGILGVAAADDFFGGWLA